MFKVIIIYKINKWCSHILVHILIRSEFHLQLPLNIIYKFFRLPEALCVFLFLFLNYSMISNNIQLALQNMSDLLSVSTFLYFSCKFSWLKHVGSILPYRCKYSALVRRFASYSNEYVLFHNSIIRKHWRKQREWNFLFGIICILCVVSPCST